MLLNELTDPAKQIIASYGYPRAVTIKIFDDYTEARTAEIRSKQANALVEEATRGDTCLDTEMHEIEHDSQIYYVLEVSEYYFI